MPNTAVTIRHARHAVHLLLSGALRDIEAEFGEGEGAAAEQTAVTKQLFNEIIDEIGDWEIADMPEMVAEMQARLGEREDFMKILAEYDLLP